MSRDRIALAVLALLFALVLVLPAFVAEPSAIPLDAALLRLLPPLTEVSYLQTRVGSELAAIRRGPEGAGPTRAWRVEGESVVLWRGAKEEIRPIDQFALDQRGRPVEEARRYWLGTDHLGRDLLPRVVAGARLSILVALTGVGGAALLAALLGVVAGYAGAGVAAIVDAVTEAMLSMPRIVLLMVLAYLVDPGPLGLGVLLALTGWPAMTRLVRAEVRQRARSTVALSGRAAGGGPLRVALRHVLPFALGTLAIAAGLRVGPYVLLEASLSFLGFGVDPPAASWGHVISEGSRYLLQGWWIATLPGLALLFVVLLVNRGVDVLQSPLSSSSRRARRARGLNPRPEPS